MLGLGEGDNFAAEKLALLLEKIQHWKSSKSRKEMCILLLDFLWMNSICYKLKDVPTTPGIAFASWDTRKTIGIFYYISIISKLRRTLKLRECFWVLPASLFTRKQVQLIVFFWIAPCQKLFFFSEKSWLFFKSEQSLSNICDFILFTLCTIKSDKKKWRFLKEDIQIGYLQYMAFFYTLTWEKVKRVF